MKRSVLILLVLLLALPAMAATLGTAANAVIPAEVQQIISVDYRRVTNSETAMALKGRVLPENLKQFETALRAVGIDPATQMDSLTFVSYRVTMPPPKDNPEAKPKSTLKVMGVANGQFGRSRVVARMQKKGIKPAMYHKSAIYPMGNGMEMAFLDDWTLVFGDSSAVRNALQTRDGDKRSLNSNADVTDLIQSVSGGAVWSVLDAEGTRNMMRSALGDAAGLADYETVKKRLSGSYYTMDFNNGVNFDLSVLTADNMTAATLSSLVKAGLMYRKMNAKGSEQYALENTTVESDASTLKVHFKSDDQRFQSLLQTDLFTAVSR
ncbi:MAG TPA: hypothetical protein VMS96_10860 [Terriglobales bacterium]|nr:hypothetical protein [Terriglobales bacterium]